MGRNASLLIVLAALVAGIFFWLLGDSGEVGAVGGPATGSSELVDLPSGAELDEQGSSTGAPTGEAERIPVPLEPPPADPFAGRLAFHESRIVGRLVDPGGAPLPGRTVELLISTSREASAERARTLGTVRTEREATTDSDGRFEFDAFQAIRSWLFVEAKHPSWPTLRLVALEPYPGQVHDLGDLQFAPAASIPLRVMDTDSLGILGAEVLLAALPTGGGRRGGSPGIAEPVGTTGADGTFVIEGLGPGRYVVGARARDHSLTWSSTIDLPEDTAEVTLTLGPGHALQGRVLDRDTGANIAGAELLINDRNRGQVPYVRLVSGPAGEFTFEGSSTNVNLRYAATAEGYLRTWGNLREERNTAGMMVLEVRLAGANETEVLVLDDATGEPIEDARLFESSSGWSPTSNIENMGLGAAEGENPGGAPDLARSDAAGLARVPTPSSDRYLLASAAGYLTRSVDLPRDRGTASSAPVEVRLVRGSAVEVQVTHAGQPAAGAVVELCLVSQRADEGLETTQASNRGWRRQPSVSVSGLAWRDEARLMPAAQAVANDEGIARFDSLPTGFYRAVASRSDTCRTVGEPIRVRDSKEDHWVELELFPPATIQGRTLLRGKPEPGQRVVAMRNLGTPTDRSMPSEAELHSTRSLADGSFELTGLGPGSWRLFALRPGQAMDPGAAVHSGSVIGRHIEKTEVLLDLVAGDQRTADLVAQGPGARLTGRVLLNHQPAAGLVLRLRFQDPDGSRQGSVTARTDSAGGYAFEGLIEGEWSITLTRQIARRGGNLFTDGVTLLADRLRIPDTELVERDFRFEVGGVLLNITAPDLPPDPKRRQDKISWVALRAAPSSGGDPVMNAWFRAGSPVELVDLPVGSYDLTITEDNVLPLTLPVEVDAGIRSELEGTLELKPKD
ncbi:MAG: carboxypeptidase-like regulatory domain-containing protein [Planctomycetota bacterium]|nr:carboxypeptidase-like regulatory domain-containing protein [Planctomycetota bacterium]